ncbi:hypothetical protein MESS2_340028 [Mesorhizobium metallidurans STM 2683]|uniref:Uncharacterized protein n=1 Tax=Mesorhizobium metallidurans STM 2683 TaxID=1297569 RepID=M5EQL8_9HYPH|nr:hypothetical protein [Mesorhizobium metallidurans]CCV06627.1 hypothetical protein MESS2_340028 [Mesorhizobium metallidurans STM 2683]
MHSTFDLSTSFASAEVNSFVVLAPSGKEFRSQAALRAVETFLKGCFPKVDFYANGDGLPFEGDYKVLPICGVADEDHDTLNMLVLPDRVLMSGIAAALKGFRPGHAPTLH